MFKSACQQRRGQVRDSRSIVALGFVALICATVVGYEFTSKGDQRNLTDYGYVEELDDPQAHRSPAGIAAATAQPLPRRFLDNASTVLAVLATRPSSDGHWVLRPAHNRSVG